MQQATSTPAAGEPAGTGQHVWVQATEGWAAGLLVSWARGCRSPVVGTGRRGRRRRRPGRHADPLRTTPTSDCPSASRL